MIVLDTTFLIDVLRGREETKKILGSKDPLLTTQINMYELIRGFFLRDMPPSKILELAQLFDTVGVLPLDNPSIIRSAEVSANLFKKGESVGDCDCLIAGIALSNGVKVIVTRNSKDFKKMKGVTVENY